MLSELLVACVLLLGASKLAVRAEGSSEQQSILLVQSNDTEYWFNESSRDVSSAVTLALEDYSRTASSPIIDVLLKEPDEPDDSPIAVISAECSGDTCQAVSSHGALPLISVSPSCWNFTNSAPGGVDRPFCMLPPLSHLPSGILGVFTNYNWTRAMVLTDKRRNHLVLTEEELVSKLDELKILADDSEMEKIIKNLTISSAPKLDRDYRIVVINSPPELARTVLCQGLRDNYNQHVWLVPGWYPQNWWRREETTSDCSNNDLEQFLGSSRRLLSLLQSPPVYLGNRSRWLEFQERCEEEEFTDCLYAGLGYDAVWAIIHALNSSSGENLYQSLTELTFQGVSGLVEFNSSNRVFGGYILSQLRNTSGGVLRSVPVATLKEEEEGGGLVLAYLPGESEETVWPDGIPPDGSPRKELKHPLIYLVAICYVLSASVIIWAVWCILFNIIFRKKKIIKLTSPMLNMMIAVGIILTNLSVPLTIYPPVLEGTLFIFCTVRSLLLPIGWSLSLGTISIKMWRVYVVYRSTKKLRSLKRNRMKRFLQDKYMMALVFCMVAVDLIVSVIALSIPVTRFYPERVADQEFSPYRDSDDIEVVYENLQCVSEKGLIWVAFLFGYKIIFLISGMVLAILTRKVEVKALNESREVQATMLITSPIVVTGLLLRLLLSDYLNVVGMVYGFSSSVYGVLVLGIIFLPKMIALYKDPAGDKIYGKKMYPSSRAQSIDKGSRSNTNASLYSTDFTTSQRILLRKGSVESGLGSSVIVPEQDTKIDRERQTTSPLSPITESNGNSAGHDVGSSGTVQSKSFVLHQGNGGSSIGPEGVLHEENNPANCLKNLSFNGEETGSKNGTSIESHVTSPRPNSRTFNSMFDSSGVVGGDGGGEIIDGQQRDEVKTPPLPGNQ